MSSTPQLRLATPEGDSEKIIRKGKAHKGGASTLEPGIFYNSPSPSLETPFFASHFPGTPSAEVCRTLNFRSVPATFSPPCLRLEGEILVTPLSLEVIPWPRYKTTEHFCIYSFTTPPLIIVPATAKRESSANSSPVASP